MKKENMLYESLRKQGASKERAKSIVESVLKHGDHDQKSHGGGGGGEPYRAGQPIASVKAADNFQKDMKDTYKKNTKDAKEIDGKPTFKMSDTTGRNFQLAQASLNHSGFEQDHSKSIRNDDKAVNFSSHSNGTTARIEYDYKEESTLIQFDSSK